MVRSRHESGRPGILLWRARSNAGADNDAAEMIFDFESKRDNREAPQSSGRQVLCIKLKVAHVIRAMTGTGHARSRNPSYKLVREYQSLSICALTIAPGNRLRDVRDFRPAF